MSSSALALQQAVYTALNTNVALAAALGGARVYDEVPQPAPYPHVSFGPMIIRDGDTSTERADEHSLTLHVWSRAHGRLESHTLSDLVRSALHDKPLTLTNHRLINLRHEQTELRRTADGRTLQTSLRFRAVTEPI